MGACICNRCPGIASDNRLLCDRCEDRAERVYSDIKDRVHVTVHSANVHVYLASPTIELDDGMLRMRSADATCDLFIGPNVRVDYPTVDSCVINYF